MEQWIEVRASFVRVDEEGRERKASEIYVIDAVSFTEAEARITDELRKIVKGDFSVNAVRKSKITDVFGFENGKLNFVGDRWFKARIAIVAIDEKAGREKLSFNEILVQADDFEQAYKSLKDCLNYVLVPWRPVKLEETSIADVIFYDLKKGAENVK